MGHVDQGATPEVLCGLGEGERGNHLTGNFLRCPGQVLCQRYFEYVPEKERFVGGKMYYIVKIHLYTRPWCSLLPAAPTKGIVLYLSFIVI